MEYRRIGRSSLAVAPLVLGGNVFGWTADEATSFAILDAFLEAGFNGIDTADAYSRWVEGHRGGESEGVIGRWMKARRCRDDVVLATKVGAAMDGRERGLSAAQIISGVEGSLGRLQTDRIDLYQSHIDDPATPLDETLAAHARLIAAGKVRVIGASNYDAARLTEALRVSAVSKLARYESLQPLYNLCDRAAFETSLQQVCLDEGVGVICMTSLAKGFLTGKFRSEATFAHSAWRQRLSRYLDDRGLRILAALDAVAATHDATCAEVALAWLIVQPGITAAIVAVDSVSQLSEIVGATRLTLEPAQIQALRSASELRAP